MNDNCQQYFHEHRAVLIRKTRELTDVTHIHSCPKSPLRPKSFTPRNASIRRVITKSLLKLPLARNYIFMYSDETVRGPMILFTRNMRAPHTPVSVDVFGSDSSFM